MGLAGLVAGSLSMAAGEFVSVASQRDSEEADVSKEAWEHAKGSIQRHLELQVGTKKAERIANLMTHRN